MLINFLFGKISILSKIFFFLTNVFTLILFLISLLIIIAYFTLGERKLMASIQRRKGPDVQGFWGIFQPLADGLKLAVKEIIFPFRLLSFLFLLSPIFIFTLSLLGWLIVPQSESLFLTNFQFSILFTFIIASLNVYSLLLSGWSSNSRYAFLGSIRASSQMIAYELVLAMINVIIALFAGSLNYIEVVEIQRETLWFVIPLWPCFLIYLIVMLAETNRTPFDLAEAEAELVAGYNVEYSGMIFSLFFLGEYSNMFLLAIICTLYFFGGGYLFQTFSFLSFFCKLIFFSIFFIWVRATLPRYRFDQLILIGWLVLLPLIFGLFVFYSGVFLYIFHN
jgi:NADH:ubiquinone oxidoreductase subunit H